MIKKIELADRAPVGQNFSDKIKKYSWQSRGEKGELMWINKNLLKVDDSYQRTPNAGKVRRIASEWSWVGCGAIICNLRGTDYLVIDGQHRVMAAMNRSDIEALPCVVFKMEDAKGESDGFLDANVNRKVLSGTERYKAMIVSGVKQAVIADNLLNSLSMRVSANGKGGCNAIQCISTIMQLIEKNEELAIRAVKFAIELARQANIQATEVLIQGLFVIGQKMRGGLDNEKLRARMRKVGAFELEQAAKRAAAFFAKGGASVWAEGMIEAINKGLKYRFLKVGEEKTDI